MGWTHHLRAGLLALGIAGHAAVAQAGGDAPPARPVPGAMAAAELAELAGRLDRAATLYRLAHAEDPAAARPLLGLARIAARLGEAEAAAELFRTAEAVAPGDREARRGLGIALVELERGADALAVFDRLLAEDPADAGATDGRRLALDLLENQYAGTDHGGEAADRPAEPRMDLAFDAAHRDRRGADPSAVPGR